MTDKQTYKEMAVLLEKLQRTAGAMEFLLRGSFLDFTALQLPGQALGDSCMGVTWPTHYIGTLRRAPVPIRLQAASCRKQAAHKSKKAVETSCLEVVHTPSQQTKVRGSRLNLPEVDVLQSLE